MRSVVQPDVRRAAVQPSAPVRLPRLRRFKLEFATSSAFAASFDAAIGASIISAASLTSAANASTVSTSVATSAFNAASIAAAATIKPGLDSGRARRRGSFGQCD